jgi:hypothetical protein
MLFAFFVLYRYYIILIFRFQAKINSPPKSAPQIKSVAFAFTPRYNKLVKTLFAEMNEMEISDKIINYLKETYQPINHARRRAVNEWCLPLEGKGDRLRWMR